MKYTSKSILIIALFFIAFFISSCSSPLNIKYIPLENPDNHLASIQPLKIKLLPFADKRSDTDDKTLVGLKRTGVRVGKEDVRAAQSVIEILNNAMKTELIRSGHSVVDVVDVDEDILINGDLSSFWLKTEIMSEDGSRPDSWDVIAEIKILLEVSNKKTGKSEIYGPYYAKNSERRFLVPDSRTMERVFEGALSKLLKKMGSDTTLASALKN